MNFDAIYEVLIRKARDYVYRYRLNIEPEELVAESYIIVSEKGLDVLIENFIKQFSIVVNKVLNEGSLSLPDIETKYCKCCNEDKPIGCFGITKRGNKKVFQTYCHECIQKKMYSKYRKDGRMKRSDMCIRYPKNCISEKDRSAFRHSLWQKNNYAKVLQYQKEWRKNKKEALAMPPL